MERGLGMNEVHLLVDHLLNWYDENKRPLPWREQNNPYYTWVSEVMLQQTQVKTVIPYFERFITALPTIQALAEVSDDRLHKLWEGLGYYRRASHLKKAAQEVMTYHDGLLPETYEALQKLSGIGRYTAGAIASIAFGERRPAIDGNLMRIFARLLCLSYPTNTTKSYGQYEQIITPYVPSHRPGDFNQAMMDLGATICLAKGAPLCLHCPIRQHCQSFKDNLIHLYPKKESKPAKKEEKRIIFILARQDGKLLIKRRPSKGLLAGLWEFINLLDTGQLPETFLEEENYHPLEVQSLGKAKHIFTHIIWHMRAYYVIINGDDYEGTWASLEEIETSYPFPSAYKTYLDQLHQISRRRL